MRLERLVGDVLDLAKLDARRFTLLREEVDMRALCERAYAAFARRRGAAASTTGSRLDGDAVLVTDGDRVLQIVSNLLSNAFRWTPEGGRVDLGLSAGDDDVVGGGRGHGPGNPAEEQERIFRPFWSRRQRRHRARPRDRARARVALGGRLELNSEPGRGQLVRARATARGGYYPA